MAACGAESAVGPDGGGSASNARLVILMPPGDIVPLALGASATLRVRYEDAAGVPIPGAEVGFELEPSTQNEGTGGSTLSATTARTDDAGVARVEVVAGAVDVLFRVRASAPDAVPVRFTVNVSENGFTSIEVRPSYGGARAVDDLARVQLRMYRMTALRCDAVDPDNLPESVFPPRVLPSFDGTAMFQSISARAGYTVIAWAEVGAGTTPVAVGCAQLGAGQVLPGPRITVDVVVRDRDVVLPATADLTSRVSLAPLRVALAERGANGPWTTLRCPAGSGQVLVDALLAHATEEAAAAIGALRGPPDELGCRPKLDDLGDATIDLLMEQEVEDGGVWPGATSVQFLVNARDSLLGSFWIDSRLRLFGPDIAGHELVRARFAVGETTYELDLAATALPVIAQSQVPIELTADQLVIGAHGFTFRAGSLLRTAFTQLALAPVGLDDDAGELGGALMDAVGCAAASAVMCEEAGMATDCLLPACAPAVAELDAAFEAGWQLVDGAALDLGLSGTAPLYDDDGDLVIDAIGRDEHGNPTGAWTVELHLSDGTLLSTSASFGQPAPVTE